MNIWTIKEGEPLPLAECVGRKMRCGILSELLSQRGNKVLWWSSDFLHQTKERLSVTGKVNVDCGLNLMLLHSPIIYKKTISIQRVLYSRAIGKEFRKVARNEEKPDIIYCSFPLVDLAYEATVFAVENGIPIVVDVRDLWPDIIYDKFPHRLRKIGKAMLHRMEDETRFIFKNATRLTATVPFDLKWAQIKVDRCHENEDKVFYMGYSIPKLEDTEIEIIEQNLLNLGVANGDFVICYFGNMTDTIIDFDLIVKAANMLDKYDKIKFVLCGTGIAFNKFKSKINGMKNVMMPGYITPAYISVLMSKSSLGILPYYDRWDFTDAVPNKGIEYLAGGLPVLSQLTGHYGHILKENKCGMTYSNEIELVQAILSYYNDKKKHKVESTNAYDLFKNQFELQKVYGDYCEYLEELVE